MSYNKISEIVKQLDAKFLYEYKHRGVPLWEVIKRKTIVENYEDSDGVGAVNHSVFDAKRLFSMLFHSFLSAFQLIFLNKRKKYLFIGFSRRIKTDDGYVDLYHDHLIHEVGEQNCLMLERPIKGSHMKPRRYPYDVIYLDFMCYLSELLSRFFFLKVSSPDFEKLSADLEARGIRVQSLRAVNREVNKFKIESWFAKVLLAQVRPKSLTVTSKWLHLPFIMVANEKGIPVYEVQHGSRFHYNLAYQGFGQFNELRVDAVLTMGDQWNSFPWESNQIVTIGNPNFSQSEDCTVKGSNDPKSALFISQPELWESVKLDVINLAKENPGFRITLRFHPQDIGNVENRYGLLKRYKNVSFEFPNLHVNESIAKHSLVIGYTSTVVFQAYDMGANVALMAGEAYSLSDYRDVFGNIINSFQIVQNYNLETIENERQGFREKFFSSFKADVWKKLVEGKAIDSP